MNQAEFVEQALEESLDNLFSAALRLVGKYDLAEDLVQETARKALQAVPSLRDEKRVRAWLFKILLNCVRDHLRRGRWRDDLDVEVGAAEVRCDVSVIARARAVDVSRALGELTPARLAVIVLIDIEDFTVAEAADMLGIPMGTAASRLARGRQDLRAVLRAYQPRIAESGGTP